MTTISKSTKINQDYINPNVYWPITVSGGTQNNPVIISFTSNITFNGANSALNGQYYFIVDSEYVEFTGEIIPNLSPNTLANSFTITLNDLPYNYTGFIQNTSYANCSVTNINLQVTGTSYGLSSTYGWLGGIYNKSDYSYCQTNGFLNAPGANGPTGTTINNNTQASPGGNGLQGGSGGLLVGDYNSGMISYCQTTGSINNPGGNGGNGITVYNIPSAGGNGGPGGSGGLITGDYNSGGINYCTSTGTITNPGGSGGAGNSGAAGANGGIGGEGGSGGGIVGDNSSGTISFCIAVGNITNLGGTGGNGGTSENENGGAGGNGGLGGSGGGISGDNFYGIITNCYTTCNITTSGGTGGTGGNGGGGQQYYGGNGGNGGGSGNISGSFNSGVIQNSYSTGSLISNGGYPGYGGYGPTVGFFGTGGLISGSSCSCSITNCYSTGIIDYGVGNGGGAGGIAGQSDTGTIDNCYSAGYCTLPDQYYPISSTYTSTSSTIQSGPLTNSSSNAWSDSTANNYLLTPDNPYNPTPNTVWDTTTTPYTLLNL